MKHLKQFLLMAMLLFTLAPLQVSAKENIDVKEILWGHIKDSYEWHITKVGDHPVVIHLPIIVNTTSGWHVFCSSEFSEEKDANGDRPGPYNLVIKNADAQANPNKIVEKVGGQEVRPLRWLRMPTSLPSTLLIRRARPAQWLTCRVSSISSKTSMTIS